MYKKLHLYSVANNKAKATLESVVLSNSSMENEMLQSVAFGSYQARFLRVVATVTFEKCSLRSKVTPF